MPKLHIEKLLLLMDQHSINFDTLRESVKNLSSLKVHVVGDTIVDTYTKTNFIGGQTKTPTFSVLYDTEESFVGGAAIVALHMRAAGAVVKFSSVVANDKKGNFIKSKSVRVRVISVNIKNYKQLFANIMSKFSRRHSKYILICRIFIDVGRILRKMFIRVTQRLQCFLEICEICIIIN